jgi:hypothetical protein
MPAVIEVPTTTVPKAVVLDQATIFPHQSKMLRMDHTYILLQLMGWSISRRFQTNPLPRTRTFSIALMLHMAENTIT